MELLPKELADTLPEPYSEESVDLDDKMLRVKFFTPDSNWTWYVSEYDPETRICFGYVDGQEGEWGYFSLAELEAVSGHLGLPVERDIHWQPKPFKELQGVRSE
jgi:hypothetical protein